MGGKGLTPATIDCRFADTTPGQVAYLSKFTCDAKVVRDAATGQKVGCSVWVG
ncbi:hypothetical protein [Mesorhizobium sp.]|uniref:hypothetical protein n=1 Tax=Mesorhizobium sp. TaxID=1871066 RepID=UPI0025CC937B|nr:hypothetical protein [Mesorhizobium sp.]